MADTQITEKYEFLTSIITSYSGAEQRISLRDIPRRYISYDYAAMNKFEAQWLRALLRMKQTNTMYIPMWHRQLYLSEEAWMGSKVIKLTEGSLYDLRGCQAIIIFKHDTIKGTNNYYRVVACSEGGIIQLGSKLKSNLNPKNAWIFPLINCSIQPTTGINYVYSNGTNTTVNFEDILDNSPLSIPYKYTGYYQNYKGRNIFKLPYTHNGRNVLTISPQWVEDDSISMDIEKVTNKLDNSTGIFQYDSKNNLSYDKTTYNLYMMCKEEINNIIRFFNYVKGRYTSFYMPSWVNDFQPSSDILSGTNYIYTEFDTLYTYYLSNNRKKKIVIFTNDYKSYIYDILSITYQTIDEKKYGKLVLSTPITENIPLSNIKMISYFNHVRLDSDELQLNYESTQVAKVTLTTKEVDDI